MWLINRRLFIIMLFCMAYAFINAQTLYWVGGSGKFNDPAHWSLTSGGSHATQVPTANTDVVFDNRSWAADYSDPVITFEGENYCRKFSVVTDLFYTIFKGNASGRLTVAGNFSLSEVTKFQANSTLVLNSPDAAVHYFAPWKSKLQGNVIFKKGTWSLASFEIASPYSLTVTEGNIYLDRATIKADNMYLDKSTVNLFPDKATLFCKNKLKFRDVNYTSQALKIVADFNDTAKVSINPTPSSVKLSQFSVLAACGIQGYSFTNASCSGLCDASITVSISPLCTTGPYTLNFNTAANCISNVMGSNTATISGAGTFTLGGLCNCQGNLVDVSLEQGFTTIDVLNSQSLPQQPTPIVLTLFSNFTAPVCAGECNATQPIRVSGGNGPYTVEVNPGSLPAGPTFTIGALTNTTIVGLCGGLQTYSITDSHGCSTVTSNFIPTTTSISIVASTRSITCNGVCNGAFSITPTGGTPNYTVHFSAGSTSSIAASSTGTVSTSGLCIGAVSATVTDSKGCTASTSTVIVQPPALTVTPTQTNVTCGGFCTGAASVAVSGGVAPYTYTWAAVTASVAGVTGLCAGNYTVNIRDNNNCFYSPLQTFSITQPATITVSPTRTNVSCNGLTDGSASVSATGGNAPVTFTWVAPGNSTVSTTSSINNVAAGVYTVFARDVTNCIVSRTVGITQPVSLTITAVSQSVICIGQCTGSSTVTVSGGNGGPYTYTWSTIPVQNTPIATNLCAGNYIASVRDASNCPTSTLISIAQPTSFTPAITSTSLNCNGVCAGTIGIVPVGGTAPYNYTLASGAATVVSATPSFTGLCAGVYTLYMTDASSPCAQIFTVNIAQPPLLVPSLSTTSISCFGACNGILGGNATGGVPGYTYSWITPTGTVAGSSLTNRCIGNYTLNVTDSHGCVKTTTTTLVQPTDMTVTINPTNVTCFSNCDGALSANVTGGTPGYTLNWSNGFIGVPNTSLCAGSYTLTVSDLYGCPKTAVTNITSPGVITLTISSAPTACAGSCDGSATITASGGVSAFSYAFNTVPAITNTTGIATGLCAGNYVASGIDGNGCSQSINFSISSPAALSAAITGLQGSCSSCTGGSTVTPANGTPGYSYIWTNSLSATVSNTSTASALCAGNYTVVITDANNCSATATVNIPQTVIAAAISGGTGIQCFGACTGSAVVSPSGGSGLYTYTWTPTGQNTQTATGLCAGTYVVIVKEGSAAACTSSASITILSPPALTINATQTNITCAGACNGAISASAMGGTGIISYSWSPGGQTTSGISNLCAGTYSLRVIDANGCTLPIQTYTITQPLPISSTFTSVPPTACIASNGSICASSTGGSGGPYTYTWLPSAANGSCITGLSSGAYSVIVSDGVAGCTNTISTLLNNPTGPALTLVSSQSIACFGGNTGAATFSVSGANPFTFTWTPAVSFVNTGNTSSAANLSNGTYVLSVSDVNQCTTSKTVNIIQPPAFTLNSTVTNPKCNNAVCNGSIAITNPVGGTAPYTYSWSPGGAVTQNLNNICAGNYTLLVTDGHACPNTYIFNVTAPPVFTISTAVSNISCNGACTGSIVANASGGTGAITYNWAPVGAFTGSTTATVLNLCANIYTINATDANGCSPLGTNTIQISEPALLTSTLVLQNASCSNSCNAIATQSASGGTLPYDFSWSTGASTTATLAGLCAGNYTGTVTDAHGCVSARGFTVIPPPAFTATTIVTNPKCNPLSNPVCSGSITTIISGAQGAVTYNWIPTGSGQNPVNLCSDNYTLTATDANSCQVIKVVSLVDPPALISNITFTNPACNGVCNGIAITSPTNAVGAVSVTWTPAAPNSQTLTGLCAGNYSANIMDANGCRDSQVFVLINPAALNLNSSSSAANCSIANGSITAIVSGGTPGPGGYTYTWTPAVSTTSVAANLAASIYTVSVGDQQGCTSSLVIPLSNANGPATAPIVSSSIACNSQCTGAASINIAGITGGTPGYTVSWISPPAASSVNPLTSLCAGLYTARVTDAAGCLLFTSVTIDQPNAISILPTLGFPTCIGVCNGSISLATSGGNGAYTYSWQPALTSTSVLTNACAQGYTVTVGYGGINNCSSVPQIITLPAATDINITTGVTPNPCFGNCNGAAFVTSATGAGSTQFTYAWSNGQNGPAANSFCNGSYSVMATSPSGCNKTFTFSINSPAQIISTVAVTQPSCNQCNGASAITTSGGSGTAFSYSWSTGANAANVSNLCAGLYQVLVTDATSNCKVTETVVVNNSSGITGETFNTQNILCAGTCNGATTVTAIGGTAPVTYNWLSPAVTNSVLNNLCAGTYYVQMSDAQGCLRTAPVNITAASALLLSEFVQQPGCAPATAGSIHVIASGGTPGYTYLWQPTGNATSSLTGLSPGIYTVTVSDNSPAHCSLTKAIEVDNLNGPVVTFTQTNIKCFGACNGAVMAAATGTGTNTYLWSNGSAAQNVTNLCPGVITLTVTSANGCMTINTFTITENPVININAPQITQPSCNLCNGSTTITPFGGILPYTYSWTTSANTPSVSNLCAGIYEVTVADALACRETFTLLINNSNGISGENFNVQNILCGGNCNGSATVTAVGGTAPFVYSWINPALTNSVITNLCAGTYFVQMTDAQNCIRTSSVEITAATSLTIAGNIVSPNCNASNGSVTLSISGGTPAYSILWMPGGNTTATLSGIGAGTYSVTIHDTAPGTCTVTRAFNVNNATGPVLTFSQTNISCFGICSGSVNVSASTPGNPAASFLYNWSNGANASLITGLCSGVITVTVTDTGTGCITIKSFTLTENPEMLINQPAITQPSCNLCNGTASVSVFGGIAPYQYLWTNSSTLPAVSGLCAGLYQVQVKDALQCEQTVNVIINNSNGITGENFNVHNILCGGNCNGSATVTAIGGTSPIAYSWINPALSSSVITNLCQGDYFVQMSDAQNCIRTASVAITAATSVSLAGVISSPNCNASNGAINLLISGGTPTYSILWSLGGNTTTSLSGIGAGTYSVTVHDSPPGSCTVTETFNVSNTSGPLLTYTQTDIRCFGTCTGSVSIAASVPGNPAATFQYSWSNGAITSQVTGLCSGVITATVTDAATGCKTIRSFTLTENPEMHINTPAVAQPSCNLCNGTASVTVFGGTAPYQYVWSNSSTLSSVANLCAGIYQVQVTDALQCARAVNVLINNSNGISGENFNVQNILCGGNCNGSATVAAVGGNAPVVYNWISPSLTSSVITNLCAGTYFVQMSDAQNCIRTASVAINAATSLSVSGAIVSPNCNASNGSINLSISGGTPAYVISWIPGGNTTATLSGLNAGTYSVTVHDTPPGSCTVTQAFNVSNTTGPVIAFSQSNIKCFGTCTGSINISASVPGNPSATFIYSWSNGANASLVTGLCPGVITLTVTDAATGCQTIKAFTLTGNTEININSPAITQPTCNRCNGTASVTVFGGTAPYQYIWTNGSSVPAVSDLCAGLYQVQVTDALQCSQTRNVIINNSTGITGEIFNVHNVQCAGVCDGAATVTAVGGTSPVSYSWISPAVQSPSITNVCAGNYFVQMTDAQGCIRNASVAVTAPSALTITALVSPPVCGIIPANGSVSVIVSGGSGSYQYSWTPTGNTSASLTNISPGSYSVTVTDATSGCAQLEDVTVSNPTGPVVTFIQTDVACFGTCTGSVVAASTSTHPLTYSWSSGTPLAAGTVTGLCAGVVTVTVTDNVTGCQTVRSFTIKENPPLQLSIPNVVQPVCHNGCDGQITLLPSGGNLPYLSYSWNPSGNGNNPQTGLCADSTGKVYTIVITDAKGCANTATVLLTNPSPIALAVTFTNASCSAVGDGSIGIRPSGGTPAYTTLWNGPSAFVASTPTITGLFVGSYSLNLEDQNGCKRDTTIDIVSTISVQAIAGNDLNVCPTASVVLTATNSTGTGTLTYSWFTNSNTVTPVATSDTLLVPPSSGPSVYTLQVNTSVPGCFDTDTIAINILPLPTIDAGPDFMIPLYSTVTIGGNPTAFNNVTVSWLPAGSLNDPDLQNPVASNTLDVTYTVTVTDNITGCVASDIAMVQIYPAIIISNGFSPNADGKNDRWIIDYIDQFPDNTVEIFNRWGEPLFYSKGYNVPFDGRYSGKDLPVGTYYYIIKLNHPAYPKAFTGPLTIFR